MRNNVKFLFFIPVVIAFLLATNLVRAQPESEIKEPILESEVLKENLIGIDFRRQIKVYLPASYRVETRRYPVVYFLHNINWSAQQAFADGNLQKLLDAAMQANPERQFIFVAGDFTSERVGSFFSNAPSSGRWLDHIVDELVPFIDANFRTLPEASARGLVGDMIGGYGALKLAMYYPHVFGSVYAMHPVGTAKGQRLTIMLPDWKAMNNAKDWQDLDGNVYSSVFMLMAQAYLPNPDKPPFFADLMVEEIKGELIVLPQKAKTLRERFLLDEQVADYADNLRRLRAIKFDWGRYDPNTDHVFGNQQFTRTLDEYGVEHEAEEFRGNPWDRYWQPNEGRFATEVLPFFQRKMVFGE